ncbi:MAG: oxidoreductase [Cryobacterium sp.]|jgi:monoamine oxidase|nr:oxidoreductase [Cryobacterium sp.]
MKRRTFLIGTISGLSLVAVSACTPQEPNPTPTASATPSPTPVSEIPRPSAFQRTSWSSDPYSRGAFSFQPVGSSPEQRVTLREPVDGRIFFAGEHTDDVNPGTVQGGRVSGRRAASSVQEIAAEGERIAIIGAGIAGATAARQLADAGYSVVIIEGRDRVGGRIDTLVSDEFPFPVELGAAWVQDSSRTTLLDELGAWEIDTEPFEYVADQRTPTGASVEPSAVGPTAVTAAITWAATQPADLSLADALTQSGAANVSDDPNDQGVSDADRLSAFIATDVVTESGAEPATLSAWYATDPTRSQDDDRYVTGGFIELVRSALDGLDILPSSTVRAITHTERGVVLRLARGESLSADRVIVTVPLGVLQTDTLTFDPPLPFTHRGAINALGMGTQDKVILRFDEPFWSTRATVWTIIGAESDYPLWYNLEPLTGEPVLVGLVGGDAAHRLAKLSDGDALDAALRSLAPFLDPDPAAEGTPGNSRENP